MSREPQDVDLVKPEAKFEPTKTREKDNETELPTYKNHLLCDEHGNYPADWKSNWEPTVLEVESKRDGFSFWYRNPQQAGNPHSVLPTLMATNTKSSAQTSSSFPR